MKSVRLAGWRGAWLAKSTLTFEGVGRKVFPAVKRERSVQWVAEYVEQAKAAEARITGLMDKELKAEWRAIANGYRNLAQARLASVRPNDVAQKTDGETEAPDGTFDKQYRHDLAGNCRDPAKEKAMERPPDGEPANNATECFVIENNVSTLFNKLVSEPEIAQRATLSRILLQEENRFAKLAERSDRFDLYVEKCDAQILKHQALLDCRSIPRAVQDLTRNVLDNMLAIKTVLRSAQLLASQRLDRSF